MCGGKRVKTRYNGRRRRLITLRGAMPPCPSSCRGGDGLDRARVAAVMLLEPTSATRPVGGTPPDVPLALHRHTGSAALADRPNIARALSGGPPRRGALARVRSCGHAARVAVDALEDLGWRVRGSVLAVLAWWPCPGSVGTVSRGRSGSRSTRSRGRHGGGPPYALSRRSLLAPAIGLVLIPLVARAAFMSFALAIAVWRMGRARWKMGLCRRRSRPMRCGGHVKARTSAAA